MRGAEALLKTLAVSGVDTCFMNPGTSEMHLVASLDSTPSVRPVLALFEGVVTGAADGYGRMAGRPAATLVHLGPGLANGLANLHNARRGKSPLLNIVGDHARYHKAFDAPLESDIESLARPMSAWFRSCSSPDDVAADVAEAVAATFGPPHGVATLVLPADVSWLEADPATVPSAMPDVVAVAGRRAPVGEDVVAAITAVLRSAEPAALLLGNSAVRRPGLLAASRICEHANAKLLGESFPGRMERGAGLPVVDRLAYLGEFATAQMAGLRHLILVDARSPVSAFAYPGKASNLVPPGCEVHVLAGEHDDAVAALEAVAESLGAPAEGARLAPARRPELPSGELTAASVADAIGALLPEGAVISDEAITSAIYLPGATEGAPPHDLLSLTGNSIGQGLPLSVGAAVACPDRHVFALEADGSAMYTIQALWTQARESLNVTNVIFDNGSYAILNLELGRVGADAGGPAARSMLELGRPGLDFVAISEGMGVPATRATTADEFSKALAAAIGEDGPHLIQAVLPRGGL
ncbi:MAG: acetolactate synthase large subunit [Acidimicrobiales bacterium]|jgi:acetolactate synthase-1/2/3 large subunit